MKKYLILLFTIFSFSIFAEKSNVVLDIQKLSKYFKTSKIQNIKTDPNVNIQFTIIAPISYFTKNIAQKDMQNIYNAVEDSDY